MKNQELSQDLETIRRLMEKHRLSLEQLENAFTETPILIPVSIFTSNAGPLGALCVYLKEIAGLRFSEIAKMLNRDPRTVWATYTKVKFRIKRLNLSSKLRVDLRIFGDRRFSIMEGLVNHLVNTHHMRLVEIARTLGRSNKTIWCFYNRGLKKNAK